MKTHTLIKFPLAAVLAAALTCVPAHAEGVGAGSLIENTATATYDDGDAVRTVDSNTIVIAVDELLDVTITSLDTGPIGTSPGEEVLAFEVTNTGNGPEAFTLNANPAVAGNDFDTTIENIAIDTNGNGVYDPGVDAILTGPEATPVLAADENITVFVITTVPSNVSDTQESDVELTVEAITGTGTPGTSFANAGVDGVDAIAGLTNGAGTATGSLIAGVTSVDLNKTASITDQFGGTSPVPGATVTFTLTANVIGTGSAITDLSISDAIPTGTSYLPGTLTLDGNPLTDTTGDDEGEASATEITVELGTVASGTSHAVTFDVSID